ncbi:MAG TPA: ABC transporter permease [Acidimicrobiales bacterium]
MLIVRKLGPLAAVLVLVTFFATLLLRLVPGDPVITIGGFDARNDPERAAAIEAEIGLDRNVFGQYAKWVGNAVSGDLGRSFQDGQKVTTKIADKLPVSLMLLVYAQMLALLIAVPLGVAMAYRLDSWIDRYGSLALFGLLAMPAYIVGILLKIIFVEWLDVLQPLSLRTPSLLDAPGAHIESMILPAFTLALGLVPIYARVLRTDLIATLKEDFIDVARAKGLPPRRILFRHALRPSSFSLLTVAGLATGNLIGGAVVVEFLFAVDGFGQLLVSALTRDDYVVLQAGIVVLAVGFVVVNFCIDLLYAAADPRLRRHGA